MTLSVPQQKTQRASSILVLHLACDVEAIREDLQEALGEAFAEQDVAFEVHEFARSFVRDLVKDTSFSDIFVVHACGADVTVEACAKDVNHAQLNVERALIQSRKNRVSWNISLKSLSEENA